LAFNQKLEATDATEDELALAADEFAKGGDNMRLHRQLFAANRLLQKKTALPKVLELMQAAIGAVDGALNVASPSAAVLADEIYESRQYAISQNLVIVMPEIPRPTLSAILRWQIEDVAGRALFQQNNPEQSIVRLKRALSVLPDKSAWSRASSWHLGEVLQANGREKEALEAFIKGYNKEIPEPGKRALIEILYVKLNGNADGLDALVGAKPESTVATSETKPTPTNTDNVKTTEPTPSPDVKPEASPTVTEVKPALKTEETPENKPEIKPETNSLPENLPIVTPEKTPEASPTPTPETVETNKEPAKTEPTPAETPKVEEVKTEPAKSEEVNPEPSPSPSPTETPVTETPVTETQPTPTPETKTEDASPEEKKPAETKTVPNRELSPTPQNVSVVITDNLSQPSRKPESKKTENKPSETQLSKNTSKPLFEPVIISVGKTETAATEKTEPNPAEEKPTEKTTDVKTPETKATDEKPVETVKKPEVVITDALKPENKSTEKTTEEKPSEAKTLEVVQKPEPQTDTKPIEKQPDEKILTGENRPRIIITENTGAKTVTEEITTCKLVVTPDSLSLLNGGGSLGVSVGFEGEGDFRRITAVSSSSEDIEVRFDPEIGASQNRAFFIIKSISAKTGAFTVTFEAPCGKKEILVKVR
jgi:hypothetical protein